MTPQIKLSTLLLLVATLWRPSFQEVAREGSGSGAKKAEPLSGGIALPDLYLWTDSGLKGDLSLPDAPHALLDVNYAGVVVSELNKTYTVEQTKDAPEVWLRGYLRCGSPYSLLMVDPDAPSRKQPDKRSWLHWMVLNAASTERFHDGDVAMPYEGPNPPQGSGPHRYVLLVYCQDGAHLSKEEVAPKERPSYRVADFAEKLTTKMPVAGCFYYVENA
ncbi:protein D1-like [Dermacentor albipictus]|uniref:protein D1-like n=1 Tax=Dermacentor albipictus TaxID=60249 RepID=UPI0031FDFA1B